jgi:hypothetical protein
MGLILRQVLKMGIIIKLGHSLSGITSLGGALLPFFSLLNPTYKTSNMIHSSDDKSKENQPVIQKDTTSTSMTLNCAI